MADRLWCADFIVQGTIIIEDDETKLEFDHPEGLYKAHLKNISNEESETSNKLSLQIILVADDIFHSDKKSSEEARKFLHLLGFATTSSFKIIEKKRIIEWTPGLDRRERLLFTAGPQQGVPRKIDREIFQTLELFCKNEKSPALETAMRWYSAALGTKFITDKFQLFWLAVEVLAEATKSQENVSDKCQKCGNPLYCNTCETISEHKPFTIQAIWQFFEKTYGRDASHAFKVSSFIRHRIAHGDPFEKIEESLKAKFDIDSFTVPLNNLGQMAWATIFNNYNFPEGDHKPNFLFANTFADIKMTLKTHMSMSGAGDPEDPQIEDFDSEGIKISVIENTSVGGGQEDDPSVD